MTSPERGSRRRTSARVSPIATAVGGTFDPWTRGVTPMTMPISRIPSWSRRRVLKAGALPFLGLDLPRLLAAEASPRDPGRPRPREVVHLHLPVRRPQPDRLVGPEARRAFGDPRAVPPHRHVGPGIPRRRVDATPGAAGGSLLRDPLDEPQRPRPRHRQSDAPGGPVAAGHERPLVRDDGGEAPAFRGGRAVAGLAPEVRGRVDAPGFDLSDRGHPGDGPRPDARRRRAR